MSTSNVRRFAALTSMTLDDAAGVERDAAGDVVAFRLFRAGRFRTDHGETTFDSAAARSLLADRDLRGNRFALDFDHLSLDPKATPEQRRAAGSFDVALRGGELWAVDLHLTEEGRAAVRSGAWLSVSPTWMQDKDGRVVSLVNCALTSNPATHGAVRLAASRAAPAQRADRAFMIVMTTSDPRGAEARLARELGANEVVPTLDAIARDRDAAPEYRERAGRVLAAIRSREKMRARMGVAASPTAVTHREGSTVVFHTLTSEQARDLRPAAPAQARRASTPAEAGSAEMRERMGLPSGRPRIERDGNAVVFRVMTAEQARRHLAG